MMSRLKCCALLFGCILALGLVATGCGNSSTTTLPPEPEKPDNPFSSAKVGTDSTLEVMTWNLEHFAKNGSQTLDMVVLAVAGLDVDIVGLQEIESSTRFDDLVSDLDGWSGYRSGTAGYSLNLAFLYRDSGLLQVDSIQEIMTDEGGPFPRRPLLLLGSFDGQPIAVINNHLKCCGDGYIEESNSRDEETRRRDACLLLEEYTLANLGNRQVFLIGDFNDEVTDPMDNNVFANFLGDPQRWAVSDLVIAEGSSSGWSFPGWPSHLDHIIINEPLFEAVNGPDAEIRVVPLFAFLSEGWSQYDRDISDHLPVVLKLKP
jgi:endonuclease/exonuclease/phosphatase family metal-dependent hydrolase